MDISTCSSAPTALTSVSQTTTGMVLSWSAPAVTSGEGVTGYLVYRNDGDGTAVDVLAYNGRLDTSTGCVVSGLTGGLEYSYQVTALSLAGESDRSVVMHSPTSPAQVVDVASVTQTTSSIALTWDAPIASSSGDQDATGYVVYRNDGVGGTDMSTVGYDGSDSTSTTGVVSGLVGGREYDFVVSALNVGGEGDVSAVFHQSTSPAAPTALHSTLQTTTSITMSWTAPVTEQGAESVTGYVLYRNDGSQGGDVTVAIYETTDAATATTSTTGTSMEVTGLAGGTMYVFSVAAKSDAGLGDRSAVASVSTSSAKPTAPSASHQTTSSISLEWSVPTVDTGVSETGYRVYEVSVDSSATKTYSLEYEGEAAEVELSSLSSGTLYTYVVSVMSDAGESDKSDEMTASTAPGVATCLLYTSPSPRDRG